MELLYIKLTLVEMPCSDSSLNFVYHDLILDIGFMMFICDILELQHKAHSDPYWSLQFI